MRISDWSSDVCSSDLAEQIEYRLLHVGAMDTHRAATDFDTIEHDVVALRQRRTRIGTQRVGIERLGRGERMVQRDPAAGFVVTLEHRPIDDPQRAPAIDGELQIIANLQPQCAERSEEHTSELQSLMRISYAVFCLKKKKHHNKPT